MLSTTLYVNLPLCEVFCFKVYIIAFLHIFEGNVVLSFLHQRVLPATLLVCLSTQVRSTLLQGNISLHLWRWWTVLHGTGLVPGNGMHEQMNRFVQLHGIL